MKALVISTLSVLLTISNARVISQDLWGQIGRQGYQNEPSVIVGQQPRVLVDPISNLDRVGPVVSRQFVNEEQPLRLQQELEVNQVPVVRGVEEERVSPVVLQRYLEDTLQQGVFGQVQRNIRYPYGQEYYQQGGVLGLQKVHEGQVSVRTPWVQELGVFGQYLSQPRVVFSYEGLPVQSGVLRSVVPQTGRIQVGVQEQVNFPIVRVPFGVQGQGQVDLPVSVLEQRARQYERLFGVRGQVPQTVVEQVYRQGVVPQQVQVESVVRQQQGVPQLRQVQGVFEGQQNPQQVQVESVVRQQQGVPQLRQIQGVFEGQQVPIVEIDQIPEIQQVRVHSEVNQEQGLPVEVRRVVELGERVPEERIAVVQQLPEGVRQVRVNSELTQEQQVPVQVDRVTPLDVQRVETDLPVLQQVRGLPVQHVGIRSEINQVQGFGVHGLQGVRGVPVQEVGVRSVLRQEEGLPVQVGRLNQLRLQEVQEQNQVPVVEQVRGSLPVEIEQELTRQIVHNQVPLPHVRVGQQVQRSRVPIDLPREIYGYGVGHQYGLVQDYPVYGREWNNVQQYFGQWNRPVFRQGLVGVHA